MHRVAANISGLLVLGLLTACSGATADDESQVLVLAASSLTDVFEQISTAFETEHPDVDVQFSFGASSALRVQVEEGAPADVVAFADSAPMEALVANGLVQRPTVFAINSMMIAVPPSNPGNVDALADFALDDLLLGVCAPQVPCGAYAEQIFVAGGIEPAIDTAEPDARSLVSKIARGELDAGLVYVTDVNASDGDLIGFDIADDVNVRAEYPIAVLDGANEPAAQDFVDFVLSPAGSEMLVEAGFGRM
jgi:molybdate transport system substrate-binding protein